MSSGGQCTPGRDLRKSDKRLHALEKLMLQCLIDRFQDRVVGIGSDDRIDLRYLRADFILIALCKAAGNDKCLAAAGLLVFRHLQYGIDAFFLCISDKTTAIDNDDICLCFLIGHLDACRCHHSNHILGVNKILVAAERDK